VALSEKIEIDPWFNELHVLAPIDR
jgi:hypothetical protein